MVFLIVIKESLEQDVPDVRGVHPRRVTGRPRGRVAVVGGGGGGGRAARRAVVVEALCWSINSFTMHPLIFQRIFPSTRTPNFVFRVATYDSTPEMEVN